MKVSIIGLGYVGLPLAALMAKKYQVIGFDVNKKRIEELRNHQDSTNEVDSEKLKLVTKTEPNNENGLYFSDVESDMRGSDFYIITVPTPVDNSNHPDMTFLKKASKTVGSIIEKGQVVIYESTVYPGATEEYCIPYVERESGLKYNQDFFAGYSPERINPGDKEKTVEKILKITSGSTPEVAKKVDDLYSSVIEAGTYKASSIKVAEAAKVIENTQRDLNIAFVNELARIFELMHIDTQEVLEAAATKWNFVHYKPGLVGGHCIGVDPYYLAQRSIELGYQPDIILSGRKLNDTMSHYIAKRLVTRMIKKDISINHSKALILGFTFKENCPDVRNTKVIDLYKSLQEFGLDVDIYDPYADKSEVKHEYGVDLLNEKFNGPYDALIGAVPHDLFKELNIKSLVKDKSVIFDIKGMFPKELSDERL